MAGGKIMIKDRGFKAPKLSKARPLTLEIKHFLECISKNRKPIVDGEEALKVTKVLEAAEQSLRRNGFPVRVK